MTRQRLFPIPAHRQRQNPPAQTSTTPSNFDRAVAISTLVSNTFVGIATATIAYVGIQMTGETDAWERLLSAQTASEQTARERIADVKYNRELCFNYALAAAEKAKGQTVKKAVALLQGLETTFGAPCDAINANVTDLAAMLIVKEAPAYQKQIVQVARQIVDQPRQSRGSNQSNLKRFIPSRNEVAEDLTSFEALLEKQRSAYGQTEKYVDFPVVSAVEELQTSDAVSSLTDEQTLLAKRRRALDEIGCKAKLDFAMLAKPTEQSWRATCDDGTILIRISRATS